MESNRRKQGGYAVALSSILFAIYSIVFPTISSAACGIDSCPAYRTVMKTTADYDVLISSKYVDFALYGTEGSYVQSRVNFSYRAWQPYMIGFQVPVTTLFWNDETLTGLSNPVVYGQWSSWLDRGVRLTLGLQVELPLGDSDSGIADSHFEFFPYARLQATMKEYTTLLHVGMRQSLDAVLSPITGRTPEAHTRLLFVDPHEAQELLYRMSIGRRLFRQQLTLSVYLDVIKEIGEFTDPIPVMRGGIQGRLDLVKYFDVFFRADRGMSRNRRTENQVELGVNLLW